jgi:hypothetical protein
VLGSNSIGSFKDPTVMAVRSSKNSTGLMGAWLAQALSRAIIKLPTMDDRRMTRSIAGRELEPIMGLPLTGILLTNG